MSDSVLIALITAGGGSVGAVLLFIQRRLPPRPASARDVAITEVWAELRLVRAELAEVVRERDASRDAVAVITESNDALTAAVDALTAAVERTKPPIVFTIAEQQAIDRAKSVRRPHDDSAWPTLGGRPAPA
ncbi:hypothetical protein [Curtobacterium sp. MCSS17_015]|uniref:hypothetical protein n=1 Tax=Curtobacterium sp. MCSS17_015 TaxID=2175666 RepID=UPI000DA977DF|nr:hypothetical protein [Curtobacterium sp. MCSS17_015]WIB25442.1 hypothetical protein DEJ18_10270 [Curtobacterium sp. MCSS17_015]